MPQKNLDLGQVGVIISKLFFYISIYWIVILFGVLFGIFTNPESNRDFSDLWINLFPILWIALSYKIFGKEKYFIILGNTLLIFAAIFFIPTVLILFIPSAYFLLPTIAPTFILCLSLGLILRKSHFKRIGKEHSVNFNNKVKTKKIELYSDVEIVKLHDQMTRGLKFYMVRSALLEYQKTLGLIVILKQDYARKLLTPFSKKIFNYSILILFYGILLSFVVIIPIINQHQLIVNKWLYLLYNLQYTFVAAIILHFSFKTFGGKGTLIETISYLNILSGSLLPIQMFLLLPASLITNFDPDLFVKGPFHNFFNTMPEWTSVSILMLLLAFYIITYYAISLFISWISFLHDIDKAKTFAVWILASPIFLIYLIFIYPILGNFLYQFSFKFLNMF